MKEEKGVALVVYKKMSWKPRYLVLKRKKNWNGWEIPKGHLEDDDYEKTVKIELAEEAGIPESEIESMDDMGYELTWTYEEDGEEIHRKYRAFLVEVKDTATVDVSENPHDEHERGHFLNFDDSEALLTYENQAALLEMANDKIE